VIGLTQTGPALILASASVARAVVLRAAGIAFTVQVASVDESAIKDAARAEQADPDETALLLAEMKAQRVARREPEALVIGADQLLVCEGRWFDKPRDVAEARAHLQALRNRPHVLVTALVCERGGQRIFHHVARPRLVMRDFSDAFLDAYLAAEGDALLSSVGGYRLEGLGIHLFDRIEGEHAAILGLPLLPLLRFLRQHGVLLR
jgi:septum formation protein